MTLALQSTFDQFKLPHPGGVGALTISVAVPDAAQPAEVPVLIVLDGDMTAGLAAEIARLRGVGGQQPTVMVVGVGYGETDFMAFAQRRTGDLTPPMSEAGRAAMGALSDFVGDQDGGADAFLDFLAVTLRQAIADRYPAASTTAHYLFGHSLAGLFTAHALLTRPEAFAGFCVMSPSLWWDGFSVLGRLPAFRDKVAALATRPRVMIGVGGREQEVPGKVPAGLPMSLEEVQAMVAASRMVDAAIEFAEALRQAGLPDVAGAVFADEDHSSVIAPGLTRAVAFAAPAVA